MRKIIPVLAIMIVLAGCKRAEQKAGDTTTAADGSTAQAETTAPEETSTGIDVGSVMPVYTAMNLDGTSFELASKRDKVVLLNLWATWCGPCRSEIPELQRIHDQYAARGFEVIGVSVDEGDVESVKDFLTERNVTYPQVLDPQGSLANILQTSVLPTTVLIDGKGKILWKKYGAIEANDTELKAVLDKAL